MTGDTTALAVSHNEYIFLLVSVLLNGVSNVLVFVRFSNVTIA